MQYIFCLVPSVWENIKNFFESTKKISYFSQAFKVFDFCFDLRCSVQFWEWCCKLRWEVGVHKKFCYQVAASTKVYFDCDWLRDCALDYSVVSLKNDGGFLDLRGIYIALITIINMILKDQLAWNCVKLDST